MNGFACPECACRRGRCLETRRVTFRGVHFIMRVRQCDNCGFHFRSKEVTVPDEDAPRPQTIPPKPLSALPTTLPFSLQENGNGKPKYPVEELERELELQRQEPPPELVIDPNNPPDRRPDQAERSHTGKSKRKGKRVPKTRREAQKPDIFPPLD